MSEATFRPKVTTIPATLNRFTAAPLKTVKKRRVAAYARVSTDEEEQKSSYVNQVTSYTDYIRNHDGWAFVKVYTDEGITGTSTRRREGFNSMIADARAGMIDLIITKSISRFARNTVDTLTHVRELKDLGIEVYFEKEGIWTLDSKGEVLITIMSSLAQEESRSISENVSWGIHKRFADGKVSLPYAHFLGYRKGDDDKPEIVPEEAEIVRNIYRNFLEGKSPSYIARMLTDSGVPSPAGKPKWRPETVRSILSNEKYKGEALLQKTYRIDFLDKKQRPNMGEVPQYYVDDSHPAIIDPATWDAVQNEMQKRTGSAHRTVTPYAFSGKIICGECGSIYGSKTWNGRRAWKCNNKHAKLTRCGTIALRDKTIEDAFVHAFNAMTEQKDEIISICETILAERCDISRLEAETEALNEELNQVAEKYRQLLYISARVEHDRKEFDRDSAEYERRIDEFKGAIAQKETEIAAANTKAAMICLFLSELRENGLIRGYDERLFSNTIERITVMPDGIMKVEFFGGQTYEC